MALVEPQTPTAASKFSKMLSRFTPSRPVATDNDTTAADDEEEALSPPRFESQFMRELMGNSPPLSKSMPAQSSSGHARSQSTHSPVTADVASSRQQDRLRKTTSMAPSPPTRKPSLTNSLRSRRSEDGGDSSEGKKGLFGLPGWNRSREAILGGPKSRKASRETANDDGAPESVENEVRTHCPS
jgi:hypothetical protein